jgi:hypothetical protein
VAHGDKIMNRINPFYLLAFLVIILLFSFFKLSEKKNEFIDVNNEYKESTALALQLSGLHDSYSNKKRIKKSIARILKQSSLSSVNIEQKITSSGIKLTSSRMNKIALNSLMGKILNASYNVKSLKILRIDKQNVSFKMEIIW